LKSTKDVDFGSEWLNYVIEFIVETETCETCVGADVQKLRQDKWHVTNMATYIKCGDNQEETVERVKAVVDCVINNLS
jgi:hypothetical protein